MIRAAPCLLLGLAILAGFIAACVTRAPESQLDPAPTIAVPLVIGINASPTRYNPAMSSTIGIRLTPVNIAGILPPGSLFTWETNFGSFYRWSAPDYRVVELGPRHTGTGEPVYWSYFSEHGEKERRPVVLNLTIGDPATGIILARASVEIGWEDPLGFTAVVRNPG